jgi:hypoxanthine phosphoribosyltransferase
LFLLSPWSPHRHQEDDVPQPLEAADPAREILTWDLFGTAVRQLAQQVVDSDFVPDLVLGIARGGLPVAGGLAYALGAKAVGTMNVEFYTGIDAHLEEPVVLPPLLDMDAVNGCSVLVVDDVADSGKTLDLVLKLVAERVALARTAVLYDKPRSVIRPDYCWRSTDRWIVFPWSAHPPVVADPHRSLQP